MPSNMAWLNHYQMAMQSSYQMANAMEDGHQQPRWRESGAAHRRDASNMSSNVAWLDHYQTAMQNLHQMANVMENK